MYDNNPNTELTYSSYKNIFINDKRKNLISGTVEDIKKITKENLLDCYNTFYIRIHIIYSFLTFYFYVILSRTNVFVNI